MINEDIIDGMIQGIVNTEGDMASKELVTDSGKIFHICVMTDVMFGALTKMMCQDPRSYEDIEPYDGED